MFVENFICSAIFIRTRSAIFEKHLFFALKREKYSNLFFFIDCRVDSLYIPVRVTTTLHLFNKRNRKQKAFLNLFFQILLTLSFCNILPNFDFFEISKSRPDINITVPKKFSQQNYELLKIPMQKI